VLIFLAALPIAAILALMLLLRWPAARAGIVGLAIAFLVGLVAFGFGTRVQPQLGAARAGSGVLLEAAFVSLTILWIIYPALCLHHLQTRTGSMRALREALTRLSPDPRISVLLVAWFFALFAEGAAGFGTPVALAAPFLVGMGFGKVEAVAIALLGHCVGVSFGAVGTPVMPQVAVTGIPGIEIAGITALPHALLGGVMLAFLMHAVAGSEPVRARGLGGVAPWAAAAGLLFLLPFYAIARWVGPELPTLGGALTGGLLFVALVVAVRRWRGSNPAADQRPSRHGGALLRAAAPYLILVVLILATRLIPPVESVLRSITWQWSAFGAFRGSVQPLFHPGTALLVAFLVGAAVQGAPWRSMLAAMRDAAKQLVLVTVALLAMLGLARMMVHAGMVDVLATATAMVAGKAWPLLIPAVGALGTFVTGSATASNILLTDFQVAAAGELEIAALPAVGGQGFGAAVGNVICPHNVIAGGATVGLAGGEGEVIRRTLVPCLVYALLGGALLFVLI
jgi:lactate permease